MIPKRDAIKIVGARFCRRIDHAARGIAKLGGVRRSLHRKFLYCLGRKANNGARYADAGIIDAISQDCGAARAATIKVQVEARNWLACKDLGIFAARVAGNVGSCQRQIQHTTIVQRNVLKLTRRNRLTGSSAVTIDQSAIGCDHDLFGNISCLERHVGSCDRGCVYLDRFDQGPLETLRLYCHVVGDRVE